MSQTPHVDYQEKVIDLLMDVNTKLGSQATEINIIKESTEKTENHLKELNGRVAKQEFRIQKLEEKEILNKQEIKSMIDEAPFRHIKHVKKIGLSIITVIVILIAMGYGLFTYTVGEKKIEQQIEKIVK